MKKYKVFCIVIIIFFIIDTFIFVFDMPLFLERVIELLFNVAITGAFLYEIFFCERYVGYYQTHKTIFWILLALWICMIVWSIYRLIVIL